MDMLENTGELQKAREIILKQFQASFHSPK